MGMQEHNMSNIPSLEATEEELDLEFQEIMRKRSEYEKEIQQETIAFQKKEADRKKKSWKTLGKVAVIVLVTGTCLIGFASRSEATRMWWLSSVERIIGKDTGHVVDNDDSRIISETTVEEAIADIEEKTGIPMPEMQYEPRGMVFDGYDYDEYTTRAGLYYLYNDYVVFISAHSAEEDSSYSWNYSGDIINEKNVEAWFGEVRLMEIKAESDIDTTSAAEWNYKNHQYQLVGKLPKEEIEKIILNFLY